MKIVKTRRGKPKYDKDGKMVTKEVKRKKVTLKKEFVEKRNLSPSTTPDEYANIMLPYSTNMVPDEKGKLVEMLSIQQLTMWTNQKAHHMGAGPEGTGYYPTYKWFTCEELCRHLGLYIWHGLQPSPRIKQKFASQWDMAVILFMNHLDQMLNFVTSSSR